LLTIKRVLRLLLQHRTPPVLYYCPARNSERERQREREKLEREGARVASFRNRHKPAATKESKCAFDRVAGVTGRGRGGEGRAECARETE